MTFFGVTLVGVNEINAHRALVALAMLAVVIVVRYGLNYAVRFLVSGDGWKARFRFWAHQAINLATTAFVVLALISIWVGPGDNHLATFG